MKHGLARAGRPADRGRLAPRAVSAVSAQSALSAVSALAATAALAWPAPARATDPGMAPAAEAPGDDAAAAERSGCPAPGRAITLFEDDFSAGLAAWRVEAQDPRAELRVLHEPGPPRLDIQTPAGLTLWLQRPLAGAFVIRFTATAMPAPASAGALAGRVSDLNMFWHAREPDGSPPRPRNGAFAAYDTLRLYYVGFGANGNTSTRLRWYDGQGGRQLLDGWADGAEATADDRQGPMAAHTRLQAGQPMAVEIVSRTPSAADPVGLRWRINGRTLFERREPPPEGEGWFGLRTTASRLQIQRLQVLACRRAAALAPP